MNKRFAAAATALLMMTGCSTFDDVFSSGSAVKDKLPGERISVMQLERALEADPRIANQQVVLPPPYVNPDWPEPGGYADNVMHHLQVSGNLDKLWSTDGGAGSSSATKLATTPIVADGRVYLLDAEATVRAFDMNTGDGLWTIDLTPDGQSDEEGRGGGVAFEGGRIFVTTGFGEMVGLEAATGSELWRTKVEVPFRAAPTASGGRVFTVTNDNQAIAFDANTGRVLWRHRGITESAGILAATSPAVSGSIVVIPYSSGEVFALRVENGTALWSDSLTRTGNLSSITQLNDIAGRPVIDRGRAYAISHSGRIVSIDMRTGERVWTRNIAGVQTPWIAGSFLFLVTTEAEVAALSLRDGRIRWITKLQKFRNEEARIDPIQWSGPVLAGDRLVLTSSLGDAVSVSPYTGEVLGKIELSGGVYIPPVVAQETLYIVTDSAELIALR
ncbi:MAG: PQQ-like beta-propeller repeat protein [Parvibaculaceae bacterium]|nr:PQQ-like beta-propeller repeat protein [Parvibaculaceae bacterium]